MERLQDEVKAALRSTDRLKLRASSDRCGISTTTKTSTAQLRRNLQQWLDDVDGLVLPPRCSAVILRRAFTTVLCSSVALVCARRDYAVISVGTLSTSILYWRKPRRGSVGPRNRTGGGPTRHRRRISRGAEAATVCGGGGRRPRRRR